MEQVFSSAINGKSLLPTWQPAIAQFLTLSCKISLRSKKEGRYIDLLQIRKPHPNTLQNFYLMFTLRLNIIVALDLLRCADQLERIPKLKCTDFGFYKR